MKKKLIAIVSAVAMVTTLLTPLSSAQALNQLFRPIDPEAKELVEFLEIEISETDLIWQDAQFKRFVSTYGEYKNELNDFAGSVIDLFDEIFNVILLANAVDHPSFNAVIDLDEQQIADIEEGRKELQSEILLGEQDFAEMVLADFLGEDLFFDDFHGDFESFEDYPSAFGYADPEGTVLPGQIVWLHDDSYNPLNTQMTHIWTQVAGPEVIWLPTDSTTDVLFIVPEFTEDNFSYLEFELMVDNGVGPSYYFVVVPGPGTEFDEFGFPILGAAGIEAAANPNDETVQHLLEVLGVFVENDDALFQNRDFDRLVNAYKDSQAASKNMIDATKDVFLKTFDFFEEGSKVNHPAIQSFMEELGITQESIDEARQEIETTAPTVEEELFLGDFFLSFMLLGISFGDEFSEFNENSPLAYGFALPGEIVFEGTIVTLVNDSFDPGVGELKITWEQTNGPEVLWLSDENATERSFIVPTIPEGVVPTLEFLLTVENEFGMDKHAVFVEVLDAFPEDDPIAKIYREILQREPDLGGHAFWMEQYNNGMSLNDIREEFRGSLEYFELQQS